MRLPLLNAEGSAARSECEDAIGQGMERRLIAPSRSCKKASSCQLRQRLVIVDNVLRATGEIG